jgi:photosystem II stability/assembly factor-like uncharacterized protein
MLNRLLDFSKAMPVYACTRDRLLRLTRADGGWRAAVALEGESLRCVAARGDTVLVGTLGGGLLASGDGGASWERIALPERDVLSVAIGAADGARYAGTEPSRVFVARDGGAWEELEALQDIPSRPRWSFPPRPWTHHVRWVAPDPHRAERLLVGIELGGVMASEDGGATFSDHRPGAKRDAHCLAWHPAAAGRAYQAAGDGAARSLDGGSTWQAADGGRDLPYCWALAVDPVDPERWYVSAASGPGAAHRGRDARGGLYRSAGAGGWERVAAPSDAMPYALAATDRELLAGMSDGRLFASPDGGDAWTEVELPAAGTGAILALAADAAQ